MKEELNMNNMNNMNIILNTEMKEELNMNNMNNMNMMSTELKEEELKLASDDILCEPFKPHKAKQPGLRANVFVSKECTKDLSEYIVEENWGTDNGMLYKYLDYIFRCQIFDEQVKKITLSKIKKEEIVIFHTGLQRRTDHNFLYFVLKQNDPEKRNAEQRWRVPAGNINQSCLSKQELMNKPYSLLQKHLPIRTKFYNSLQELLFDESYTIEVNWQERLRTNKERIYQELKNTHSNSHSKNSNNNNGNKNNMERNKLVSELTEAFNTALQKAANRAKANPRLAVAQGFVETKHYKKRVELLLPLQVEYPKDSKKYHTFALALRKVENQKKYTGMSLLTMSMAYANARLVGYVDSSWLTNDQIKNRKDHKKDKKEKLDKERLSTHASPQNSISNSISNPEMIAMKQPQTMMFGPSNGRMTFAPQRTVRSRSGINTAQHQYYNVNSTHAIAQSLPPIPANQPMINHIPVRDVDFNYHNYQQQPIIPHTLTHPYISDTQITQRSDNNPPLSQYDNVNVNVNLNHNNNNKKDNNNNNLKFSQSALPTITHLPP
eukprot:104253_1